MGDGRLGGARSGGPECLVPESGRDALGKGALGGGWDRARRERGRASMAPVGIGEAGTQGKGPEWAAGGGSPSPPGRIPCHSAPPG